MPCFPLKALVAILKNGRQSFQQNSEKTYFPYFLMYLAMKYMNFMFLDITGLIYCTENFKMATVFRMAPKTEAKV